MAVSEEDLQGAHVRIGTLPESSSRLNGRRGAPQRWLTGPPRAHTVRAEHAVTDHVTPLLPESLDGRSSALRAGCHLLRFSPREPLAGRYDGTLRVEHDAEGLIASGDLYVHGAEPDPRAGIPVFTRARYRGYLRVTRVVDDGLTLGLEFFDFDHSSNTWLEAVELSAHLGRATAPEGYPSRDDFLVGGVRDASGGSIGRLTIGWVWPDLRRAVVELDRVAESETPLANAAGLDWVELFKAVGWDVTIEESDVDVIEPSGESWSSAELHAEMLRRRTSTNLDEEWRYWLVSVRRLDEDDRGFMFDRDGADSNNVPREAAGLASHWMIPDEDPWGLVRGKRFGSVADLYFRTALHEIGHAMGLEHNTKGIGIMCPTLTVAQSAVAAKQFPENVEWSYVDKDSRRLRHLPDHWVRPGGVPFGTGFGTAPRLPDSADVEPVGLELDVSPLLPEVPIGAPVRVDLTLRSTRPGHVAAPLDLSLKSGQVHGAVTDRSGTIRSFRPLVRYTEQRPLAGLAEGGTRTGSLTLLRGAEGALFPTAGDYTVEVHVEWESSGMPRRVTGSAVVAISAAVDEEHAEAARRVIGTPDALLTLVLGGDHLTAGLQAIHAALANEVLKPHFAYVEAKRRASGFQHRPADPAGAAGLIDADTVMSAAEVDKVGRLVEAAARRGEAPPKRLVTALRARALDVSGETSRGPN